MLDMNIKILKVILILFTSIKLDTIDTKFLKKEDIWEWVWPSMVSGALVD